MIQSDIFKIMDEETKNFWRQWQGVLILAIIAAAVIVFLLRLEPVVDAVQHRLTAFKYYLQVRKLTAPYKNDKYGGKTPEETFDLFLDALRKEDIDLASKYFVIPKRDNWEKSLEEYKKTKLLASFILELENNRKHWEKEQGGDTSVAEFYFTTKVSKETEVEFGGQKLKLSAGDYSNTVRFEKYPSGVWKISEL